MSQHTRGRDGKNKYNKGAPRPDWQASA